MLSDDLLDYLLTRFDRQLGGLMQLLLGRLDTFALSHKRELTLPLLKQMLCRPRRPPTRPHRMNLTHSLTWTGTFAAAIGAETTALATA